MKLYITYIKYHFKTLLEYKLSTILSVITQLFYMFTEILVIDTLFNKFSNVAGFTVYEVLICFGIINIGFSLNEVFARGVDQFDDLIINGSFDRLLLRPRGILLQVLCSDICFYRGTRVIFAFSILVYSLIKIEVVWTITRLLTVILMIIASICIFFSIFLLTASYCFVTVQGLEIRNVLTDGGRYLAQYPISIYNKIFKVIFTYIIPFALVNYYPLLYLLGRTDNVIYMLCPLLSILTVIPSVLIFNRGAKKYLSTGS